MWRAGTSAGPSFFGVEMLQFDRDRGLDHLLVEASDQIFGSARIAGKLSYPLDHLRYSVLVAHFRLALFHPRRGLDEAEALAEQRDDLGIELVYRGPYVGHGRASFGVDHWPALASDSRSARALSPKPATV